MVASVPEFTRRTISIDGTAREISSASSTSRSVGAPKLVPIFEHLAQRLDHRRRAMPQQQRSPGADVVDVRIAVDVENARAFAARDETGRAADAAKRAHRRIHAARNHRLRPRETALRIGPSS